MSEQQKNLPSGLEARAYQQRAHDSINALWSEGARAIVLVSPTGSGKTAMLTMQVAEALQASKRVLWIVHRRDLVEQAEQELIAALGSGSVSVIMAGRHNHPSRPVQVASVQTLLERDIRMDVDLVAYDECHHSEAATCRRLLNELLTWRRLLGATATPERDDGRALGDTFQHMVVAASHSELIRDGYLVKADVLRPAIFLGSDLAIDPVRATVRNSAGHRTIMFARTVASAYDYARQLRARKVRAEAIEGEMSVRERAAHMRAFKMGDLDVIVNVGLLTEGINIRDADVGVLARPFLFSGSMIQATGRVLRPAPGKTRALIVDLSGCTHRHGFPDSDRTYSLTGKAISSKDERVVEERSPATAPAVLDVKLWLESRWETAVRAPNDSVTVEALPEALAQDLERIRSRALERGKRVGKRTADAGRRMREAFVTGERT